MFIGVLVSNSTFLDPWFQSKYYWIAALLPCIPIFTHINSLLHCILSQVIRNQTRQPPQVPYYLPIIGNAFEMLFNTERFLVNLQRKFGQVPFQLKLGPKRLYYVAHGDEIQTLFSRPTELLGTPHLTPLLKCFGMPKEDIKLFEDDKSGHSPTPAPGFENMDPNKRVHYGQRMEFVTFLQGSNLDMMTNSYANRLSQLLQVDATINDDWTVVPDLYDFTRRRLLRASIETLCGEHVFSLCPTFDEDFWAYDSSIRALIQEAPRWWAPKAYASRDRMHENLKAWQKYASDRFDWEMDDSHVDFEPLFGSRLMRAMQRRYRASGFSETGKAANTLGLLIASNANEIPIIIWVLLDIILSPNTTSRVLVEIQDAFDPGSTTPDIATLLSGPLMSSIFMETMRLRSAGSIARICKLGGRDETFWNAGRRLLNSQMEHPLNTFWAERFLSYPDDPSSGPVRRSAVADLGRLETRERTPADDRRATVVTKGLSNHFFPFGGGVSMCPGRTFARHEIMTAVAVVLRVFEIEPVDAVQAGKTKTSVTSFPFGSLGFDRKVPVRIRRRKLL
ncbi:Cytochrome P450 monooxygenase calL-like protein [Cladobotryum mycophilum]|uniref:Cytochrome P450 monooxygenase calL-like protein n=1 Tax=Cladobotryum mycophilum TaxID=491253 RepID=A0ABR0SVR4_9HYPO